MHHADANDAVVCIFSERCRCCSLCVHRPPVQLSVASAAPSHSRPPCLGSGAVHSLPRCLSHSSLHTVHSLHWPQPPSTKIRYKHKGMMHIICDLEYSATAKLQSLTIHYTCTFSSLSGQIWRMLYHFTDLEHKAAVLVSYSITSKSFPLPNHST